MSGRSPVDAIARIEGQGLHGTGFLVRAADQRLLVLTAGHVADAVDLKVTFVARGFTSPASVARRDAADPASPPLRGTSDWAALACTSPIPADLDPIELDEFDGPPDAPFETFGYPTLYGWGERGGPLRGTVRRMPGGQIQPWCDELAGGGAGAAAGISGAPCLVADVAIGVIHEVLAYGGAVVGGSLLVVLASTIATESGGVIALATGPGLPYLPETERPLEALNAGLLQDMASALELDAVAGRQVPTLRRRVARGLLIARPDHVADALVSVKEEDAMQRAAAQIIVRRESLAIPAKAVQGALLLVDSAGAVALDAKLEVSTRWLLRRVSRVRGNRTRWYLPAFCLIVNPKEDRDAVVVDAVRAAAAQQFPGTDLAQLIKTRVMFAAIYRTLPRTTTRDAVWKEFPELRVVFCSARPTDPAVAGPVVEWLEPFTAADEGAWRTACLQAREHLRNNAVTSLDDDALDRMD